MKVPSITMDLCYPSGDAVSKKMVNAVTEGCRNTFFELGLMGAAIKAFFVTFERFNKYLAYGPCIEVVIQDTIGNVRSFTTDYRFIAFGKPNPTASQIVKFLCSENQLPDAIEKHLECCRDKIGDAYTLLEIWNVMCKPS